MHVVDLQLSTPSPSAITEKRGTASPPVSFQVTVQGTFDQSVTLGCGFFPAMTGASCAFTPGATVNPTPSSPVGMNATVTVPLTTPTGNYTVTLQATTAGAPAPITTSFTLSVILNPDFVLGESSAFPEVNAGSIGTSGPITISSQDGFSNTVSLTCATTFGANSCDIVPSIVSTFPATATLTINGTSLAAGTYQIGVQGTSGATTHTYQVAFDVGDFLITGTQALSADPGAQATANLSLTSSFDYSGQVNATCNTAGLSGTQCTLSSQGNLVNPGNPISISRGAATPLTAAFNIPNNAVPGLYSINIVAQDTSGSPRHSWTIGLTVTQDFTLSSLTPASQTDSLRENRRVTTSACCRSAHRSQMRSICRAPARRRHARLRPAP